MDLVEFLKARLDEDERVARACQFVQWEVDGPPPGHYAYSSTSSTLNGWAGPGSWAILATPTGRAGQSLHHAARHDPARVLAEVEAKRRIIDRCAAVLKDAESRTDVDYYGAIELAEDTLRQFAMPDADHPDYQQEWRV